MYVACTTFPFKFYLRYCHWRNLENSHSQFYRTRCLKAHWKAFRFSLFLVSSYLALLLLFKLAGLVDLILQPDLITSLFKIPSSNLCLILSSVQFSHSVLSDSLRSHESQHARPPCPSPIPGVYSNSCPLNRWCHPATSSSVGPFSSCPQSLPASGPFLMSQLFAWGGQSIAVSASASVLPMNTQDWSSGWTGWISLQSKGLSKSSPTPQFKSINSSSLSFLHSPTLTSIHDHWKNHSLDQTDLCWQSNVSAF